MNADEIQDLDFSSIFEDLTDKLGAETAAPFLSKDNAVIHADVKEKLFMKLLAQYEYEAGKYLGSFDPNHDASKLSVLQEVLIKHKSI